MSLAINKPRPDTMVQMTFLDALVQAQIEELERDERVIVMGEDIAVYGGGKLVSRFDERRIWSMPISETSFTGVGIGAAMTGLRPIVDLSIASFMYLASDPIINQASKLRYMTGGQVKVPVVFRCCMYYGSSLAAQHSDRPYPQFLNVPGLKIISPTSPADIKGLLKSAVRDDDPVLIFEDTKLWPVKGEVPTDPDHLVPIGKAEIKRAGSDVTVVAIGGAMRLAMDAAKDLAEEGISIELIDPRTLKPLDMDTIMASVAKTGRLVLVENAHRVANLSSEIAALIAEEGFESLKKPIRRLCAPDVHVPFSPALEQLVFPGKAQIVSAVKGLM
ncbi:TPP-dependent acetoin dehydrogenase complex, E1 protein subunit beta [Steroidobacter agaridevorans]|uniref:Branched-chain alpha-keto acid dehydrogenase E1 component beta chain n=1 Tax=Steroidobacter agaridevorans TaxID=2695856 RepID=A0A829YAJ7_9GAMM|nr:alpha-ketoacid dehydrogenase subunit beta [Steroidobacter agaridevorans]GFE79652.1 TPP-dependent acetoin dehydrogenase complex, E1 protein subunit beta [Steroidobacter agaridevorans]